MYWIRQILGRNFRFNEAVHQLFVHFYKAYDKVRIGVLYAYLARLLHLVLKARIVELYVHSSTRHHAVMLK
jgi:hypothetical protein